MSKTASYFESSEVLAEVHVAELNHAPPPSHKKIKNKINFHFWDKFTRTNTRYHTTIAIYLSTTPGSHKATAVHTLNTRGLGY